MRIVVSEFVTLDGVMEAPHEWSFPYWTEEIGKFKHEELITTDVQLLGRVTYEEFAESWPSQTDETGFAERMNSLPKYVVSKKLKKADWNNSTIIKGNIEEEISKLKEQTGSDILVAGSAKLVGFLMEHDLVDEYRLLIHPVVLGKGKRLFPDRQTASLILTESETFVSGVTLLRYEPARKYEPDKQQEALTRPAG
jgi:dihydrofolate reductase